MEWVRRIFPTAILLPREYYGGVLQPQMQKTLYYVKINRKCKKIDLLLFFHLPSMINPLERFGVFTENRRVIHPSLSV